MRPVISVSLKIALIFLILCVSGNSIRLFAQSFVIDEIEDKELLEIMIEDTTGELARNQASLDQAKAVYIGWGETNASDQEFRRNVEEHIQYYDEVIASQTTHLAKLRDQRKVLEKRELEKLRNLLNFGSPYQDRRRTAFLDLILQPRSSSARFGESGKTRMEALDEELFSALGGLQGRLNQEDQNRQEAGYILLDREANVNTILEMQKVSQSYYDERFVLYDKMNQTYEQILRWRPDLAIFFKPPPQPKPPEAYKRALERMQADQ
ncbi:MAG: hypothetical protein O7C75_17825 [Verrucomicrobia bacterium]|nr:hypothetical protein [Verrucomicrobiota bacterium]